MTAAPLRVALLGAGTVGGEIVRAFAERRDRLAPHGGRRLELVGIAVRDVDAAQQEIITLAREMEKEGVISLQSAGNDQYVY